MPPPAVRVVLRDGDLGRLLSLMRASTAPAGLVQRARIVLLAAEGVSNTDIAVRVGATRQTVVTWRKRYVDGGYAALADADRSGRPPVHDEVAVVVATLEPPPERFGVTHWSTRLLADQLGISFATVARIWRKWKLQPWRIETFTFSTDPELEAKIRDVVGLYLAPPDKAVVVCVDEKSQVQALDRTAPVLPLRPGIPAKQTHDYVRHGTTTLFAALDVATGKVTDRCYDRHRHEEFLAFLKVVAKAYPRVALHIVCDNYATHKHPAVKAWLVMNPRITMHFTPTSGSWLTWWRSSSGSSPAKPSDAAPTAPSPNSSTPSSGSSTAGTNDVNPSSGPRPPTTSPPRPFVQRLQTRDTSALSMK